MGGGPSSPALVAAVSEAGGLGSLAGGYSSPDKLRADIAAVRAATDKPFAVNLSVPTPAEPGAEEIEVVLGILEAYRVELGLPPRPAAAGPWSEDFDSQVAVLVEERVPVTSFTFGLMPAEAVAALHDAGSVLIGTAFLRCPEAGTSAPYRRALAAATETSTAVTTAITGRMARGVENRLMRDLRDVPELMSLWCGQGIRLATELPAGELVHRLADEASTIARLGKATGG